MAADTSSTEFQIAFLRAVIKHRPIGLSKHFSMLGMQKMLLNELGRSIDADTLWATMDEWYNMKEMDHLVRVPLLCKLYRNVHVCLSKAVEMSNARSTSSSGSSQPEQLLGFDLESTAQRTADHDLSDIMYQRRFRQSASPDHRGDTPAVSVVSEKDDGEGDSPLTDPGSPLTEAEGSEGEAIDESAENQDAEAEAEEEDEEEGESERPAKKVKKTTRPARGRNTAKKEKEDTGTSKLSGAAAISAKKKAERLAGEEAAAPPSKRRKR